MLYPAISLHNCVTVFNSIFAVRFKLPNHEGIQMISQAPQDAVSNALVALNQNITGLRQAINTNNENLAMVLEVMNINDRNGVIDSNRRESVYYAWYNSTRLHLKYKPSAFENLSFSHIISSIAYVDVSN
uniref:Elf4 domain-containing protein n=1 Tax=Rhabditophanes sp. KR3021 TaxID=114890 RepID=A0AC35TIH9_9BILA